MDTYKRVEENVQKLNFCIAGCKYCVCLFTVNFVVKFVQGSLIMLKKNRLSDSLSGRVNGNGVVTSAAMHLNVSRSVIQRLWNEFQTTDLVSGRPVLGRPRFTTPAKDLYLALSVRRRRVL